MFSKLNGYFKGVNQEAHRIRWPIKNYLWKNVGIVLGVCLTAAIVIFLLDTLTAYLMRGLVDAFPSVSSPGGSDSTSSSQVAMMSYYIVNFFNSIGI